MSCWEPSWRPRQSRHSRTKNATRGRDGGDSTLQPCPVLTFCTSLLTRFSWSAMLFAPPSSGPCCVEAQSGPLREQPETGGQNGISANLETQRRDRTDSTCNLCNLHPEPSIAEGSHRGGYRELARLPQLQLPSKSHLSRVHPGKIEK